MRNVKELHKYFLNRANSAPISSAICSKSFTMKLTTFVSAGAFIFFSAFVMKKEAARQASSLYNTQWSLKKIHFADSVGTVTGNAFIKFNQDKKSAGGNGSCNAFGSIITVSGYAISFSEIFSTRIYCDGNRQTESAFFNQLEKVNRFEVRNKALMLFKGNALLLEFESK